MAKGYKKYIGHEYAFTKPASSGLGKELSKQKSSAQASKASDEQALAKGGEVKDTHDKKNLNQLRGSFDKFLKEEGKEHPKKEMSHGAYMADGGTVPSTTPNPNSPSSMGVPTSVLSAMGSGFTKHYKGGEAKKKDNRKDIGDDNKAGSIYELGSSYKKGGKIPGKAKVKGDSPENDTVNIKVSPGEDILPRSVSKAKDAPEKAKQFVKKLQKEEKDKKRK